MFYYGLDIYGVPFCLSVEVLFSNDPVAVVDTIFFWSFAGIGKMCDRWRDARGVARFKEIWTGEAFDSNVKHSMLSSLQLAASYSWQHVTNVHRHGVRDRAYRLVHALTDVNLKTWIAESRKKSQKSRVCVDWSRQTQVFWGKLVRIYYLAASREIVRNSESRSCILFKPGIKEVCILSQTLSDVWHDLQGEFVHHLVVPRHKRLEFLTSLALRPRCLLMKWVPSFLFAYLCIVPSDFVKLLVRWIIRNKRSEAPVMVGVLLFEMLLV